MPVILKNSPKTKDLTFLKSPLFLLKDKLNPLSNEGSNDKTFVTMFCKVDSERTSATSYI